MELQRVFLFLLLISISVIVQAQYGRVIIEPQPLHELDDPGCFSHDYFSAQASGIFLDSALSLRVHDSLAVIMNQRNDGFSGYRLKLVMDREMNLVDVHYTSWTDDLVKGAHTEEHIEQAILSMNANPFTHDKLEGRYSLVIRSDFIVEDEMKQYGLRDSTTYSTLCGKFKFYSEEEKKMNKRDILYEFDLRIGARDSAGLYYFPDVRPAYKYGIDSLQRLLQPIFSNVDTTSVVIVGTLEVGADGETTMQNLRLNPAFDTWEIRDKLQNSPSLFRHWMPGTAYGYPVRSVVRLEIDSGIGDE